MGWQIEQNSAGMKVTDEMEIRYTVAIWHAYFKYVNQVWI